MRLYNLHAEVFVNGTGECSCTVPCLHVHTPLVHPSSCCWLDCCSQIRCTSFGTRAGCGWPKPLKLRLSSPVFTAFAKRGLVCCTVLGASDIPENLTWINYKRFHCDVRRAAWKRFSGFNCRKRHFRMYWFGDSIGPMKWHFLVFPMFSLFQHLCVCVCVFLLNTFTFTCLDVKSKISLAKHLSLRLCTKSLVASTILGSLGHAESIGGDRSEEFNWWKWPLMKVIILQISEISCSFISLISVLRPWCSHHGNCNADQRRRTSSASLPLPLAASSFRRRLPRFWPEI